MSVIRRKFAASEVLHLTDDGYRLCPVRCDEPMFDVFKYVRELHFYLEEMAPEVVGEPALPSVEPFQAELVR